MAAIDLKDYVCGGYFVGRYITLPGYQKEFLPERLLSISSYRGDLLSLARLIETDPQAQEYFSKFGIPETKYQSAINWGKDNWNITISFPDVFYSLETAQEFVSKFLDPSDDLYVVGIGLNKFLKEEFFDESDRLSYTRRPAEFYAKRRLNPKNLFGIFEMVNRNELLTDGGQAIGFDVVVHSAGFVCSYVCNVDQFKMVEELNTYPNQYGLIDSYEIACEVRSWRDPHDDYYPWLIVQYPVN